MLMMKKWCCARPNRTPLDQRKCLACNNAEDEFDFLLECVLRGLSQKVVDFLYNKKTIRSIAIVFYL